MEIMEITNIFGFLLIPYFDKPFLWSLKNINFACKKFDKYKGLTN